MSRKETPQEYNARKQSNANKSDDDRRKDRIVQNKWRGLSSGSGSMATNYDRPSTNTNTDTSSSSSYSSSSNSSSGEQSVYEKYGIMPSEH
jgi:hypothetical protein